MKNKKVLALIISLVLVLTTILPASVSAAGTVGNVKLEAYDAASFGYDITTPTVFGTKLTELPTTVGSIFIVRVMVDSITKVKGMELALRFDPNIVSVNTTGGGVPANQLCTLPELDVPINSNNNTTGYVNYSSATSGTVYNDYSNIAIFEVKFKVKALGNPNIRFDTADAASGGFKFLDDTNTDRFPTSKTDLNMYVGTAPSTDATLSALNVDGTLVTGFAAGTHAYTVTVPYGTTTVPTVTATKADTNANVNIVQAANLTGLAAERTATVTVTAQDGTTIIAYTVVFSIGANTANDITSFTFTGIVGTATINAANHTVTALIPFGTDRSAIVPTIGLSTNASINPLSGVAQNFASAVSYTVTSESGTPQVWNISINETTPVSVQTITISGGNTISVDKGTLQLSKSIAPADASIQTVTWSVQSGSAASVNASGLVTAVSNGTAVIRAAANDGSGIYSEVTITVTNQVAAGLTGLVISQGALTPAFAQATTTYTAGVASNITSLTVTPTTAAGTITVNGTAVTSGSPSGNITLVPGTNVITIIVTETNKAAKTYTMTVTRAYPASITAGTFSNTGGISANARVSADSSMTAVVIFKLMNGTTPVSIVAVTDTIGTSEKTYTAQFPGYAGTGYTVKAYVWDQLTNDLTTVGINQASPATIQ